MRLCKDNATDVGLLSTPNNHDEVRSRATHPRFQVPPTRRVFHTNRQYVHSGLPAHGMIAIVRRFELSTHRESTITVAVGRLKIGGGQPIVVQAMTNTDTADDEATTEQCLELATAGAEMIRIPVDRPEAAAAVRLIRRRLDDLGCHLPLVGDFHFNGHLLLRQYPECARTLDKFRINPGTVARRSTRDGAFDEICALARDHGKPIRIGVNSGSLDQNFIADSMRENAESGRGRSSDEVIDDCMVAMALDSTARAVECGLAEDRIIVSCKASSPSRMIAVYRQLARHTDQPLHVGLTEAGLGTRGIVWSAAAMAVLLEEGIGDTIRVSLTPRVGAPRSDEVAVACELLQALGLRAFAPTISACPGCGRTTSTVFQELAVRVGDHIETRKQDWLETYQGVEQMTVAVMGCVVNGPGESRAANIGISLPGTGEEPRCPVFMDGRLHVILEGPPRAIEEQFLTLIEDYVLKNFPEKMS